MGREIPSIRSLSMDQETMRPTGDISWSKSCALSLLKAVITRIYFQGCFELEAARLEGPGLGGVPKEGAACLLPFSYGSGGAL